jgi:hypothetical protein
LNLKPFELSNKVILFHSTIQKTKKEELPFPLFFD